MEENPEDGLFTLTDWQSQCKENRYLPKSSQMTVHRHSRNNFRIHTEAQETLGQQAILSENNILELLPHNFKLHYRVTVTN